VEAFGTFSFLLRAPGQIREAQVAEACRLVHEWADAHSLLLTGVHFAEAAGIVAPDDPARANDAGWMCYRAALYDRAETWYRRGYGLAVQMRHRDLSISREQSIRALLRTGILMQTLGRHEKAKEYFELAARRAVRTGRRPEAAKANHDLLTYMAEVGTYEEAEKYANQALDLYAHDAPRLPVLAHDYGFLLVRFSFYTHAVPLLQLSVARIIFPEVQALAWGTLARAAACAGRRELFESAEGKAVSQVALHQDFAPAVFVNLGEGARALREWDQAESYAAMGLEAARDRQQASAEYVAMNLLDQIAARQPGQLEEVPPSTERIQLLTRRFTTRLRKWKAPGLPKPGADAHGE
jgi:tetratricopeptide (TPR) repeat protein